MKSAQGETYTEHCRRIETQLAAERALNAQLVEACKQALLFIETQGWNATAEDQEMTGQLRAALLASTEARGK